MRGREAPPRDHPPAVQQHRADADQPPGRVIQRQDVEQGVLRRRGRGPGEGAHIGPHPRMRHPRRLGQAGRARGVDVQGRVAVGHALTQRTVGPYGRCAAHGVVQVAARVGLVLFAQAVDPDHQVAVDQGARVLDRLPAVLVRHHVEGGRDGQAVGQGRAGQIVVDQGGGHPDLGEAEPGGHVFHAVVHHQGDDVAALQIAALGPVGVAVRQGLELAIGQLAALVLDRDVGAEPVDRLLDVVTGQDVAVERDGLDALQKSEQPASELDVTPDVCRQSHGCAASSRLPLSWLMDGAGRRVNRRRRRRRGHSKKRQAFASFSMT